MQRQCAALIALGICAALIDGCARYERRPLTLDRHAADWPARQLDIAPVRAYAAALHADEQDPPPFDLTDGLSLDEAEAVALVFNPTLRAARAEVGVPLATAREAGWWPDPAFEAEVLRFTDRGSRGGFQPRGPSLAGVNTNLLGSAGLNPAGLEASPPGIRRVPGNYEDDPWDLGARLSLTIPISGRLAVERDWAWADFDAAWQRVLLQEWQTVTTLRLAWLDWSAARARADVLREYVAQLDTVTQLAERLAGVGELTPAEARVLRVGLTQQELALVQLDAAAQQQIWEIYSLLGLAPETHVTLLPRLDAPRIAEPREQWSTALLHNHPQIRVARAAYDAREQQLRLEVRRQYPDLQIGPGFAFEDGISRVGLGFGFTLPLWNHNRQAVAAAQAARVSARIQAETTVERLLGQLPVLETQLDVARRARRLVTDELTPLVDQQVAETRQLLELGEVSILILRDALAATLTARQQLIDATLSEARIAQQIQQMLAPRYLTPPPTPEDAK